MAITNISKRDTTHSLHAALSMPKLENFVLSEINPYN
jgi:hypothetical protein